MENEDAVRACVWHNNRVLSAVVPDDHMDMGEGDSSVEYDEMKRTTSLTSEGEREPVCVH